MFDVSKRILNCLYRYQASTEQFARAGTDPNRVPDLCRSAVLLAAEARRHYLASAGANMSRRPKIALSIGPYGATLPAAEEYDGMYPPPFGPVGVSASRNAPESPDAESTTSNVFNAAAIATPEEKEAEAHAEDALFEWHLERLRIYAGAAAVWDEIDVLAFETVPLAREARAIRRAISDLFLSGAGIKPWWISFTFPQGEFPQRQYVGGPPIRMESLVEAIFSPLSSASVAPGEQDLSTPSAIGINCTPPSFIPALLESMSRAMSFVESKLSAQFVGELTTSRQPNSINSTWLVVYPNGGLIYQPHTRRWIESAAERSGDRWVNELFTSILNGLDAVGRSPWGGVILGGSSGAHRSPFLMGAD
jgi:homocysteine S-methyltransferase